MNRQQKIIELTHELKKVEVSYLAKVIDVSEVTIRKDLSKLEKLGFIKREHGYAIINNEDDLNFRMSINYQQKKQIATKAAESIHNGETIFIESGSTCTLLAEELTFNHQEVTIVTNSYFIAERLRHSNTVNVVLLGGIFQKDSRVTVGPMVKEAAKNFYCEKFFLGIDGFDDERGFTGIDLQRSEVSRYLAERADQTIILTDSSKFNKKGTVKVFDAEDIYQIYTDSNITQEHTKLFESMGIIVTTI